MRTPWHAACQPLILYHQNHRQFQAECMLSASQLLQSIWRDWLCAHAQAAAATLLTSVSASCCFPTCSRSEVFCSRSVAASMRSRCPAAAGRRARQTSRQWVSGRTTQHRHWHASGQENARGRVGPRREMLQSVLCISSANNIRWGCCMPLCMPAQSHTNLTIAAGPLQPKLLPYACRPRPRVCAVLPCCCTASDPAERDLLRQQG